VGRNALVLGLQWTVGMREGTMRASSCDLQQPQLQHPILTAVLLVVIFLQLGAAGGELVP
jgi:hypothetical protein